VFLLTGEEAFPPSKKEGKKTRVSVARREGGGGDGKKAITFWTTCGRGFAIRLTGGASFGRGENRFVKARKGDESWKKGRVR